MPDTSTIAVFMLATGALLIVPGPSVLYIVARGIDQGRRAALGPGVTTEGAVVPGAFLNANNVRCSSARPNPPRAAL
ncbi:MAG: hypothetical protein QOF01_2220 [Thermomicrobiales bacterium]|jgi:threonine/homoserine/homoserine lactone efflux protein|nr:hypothetical protein [Thermomicrobiales bacterium]